MSNKINFTPALLKKLKKQYETAIQNNQEQFQFEGHELLTSYAKYMIEYLETQFNPRHRR